MKIAVSSPKIANATMTRSPESRPASESGTAAIIGAVASASIIGYRPHLRYIAWSS